MSAVHADHAHRLMRLAGTAAEGCLLLKAWHFVRPFPQSMLCLSTRQGLMMGALTGRA